MPRSLDGRNDGGEGKQYLRRDSGVSDWLTGRTQNTPNGRNREVRRGKIDGEAPAWLSQ